MTNGDMVRQMSDEDLALVLMCPYDTAGDPVDIMPCIKEYGTMNPTQEYCHACLVKWLKREKK